MATTGVIIRVGVIIIGIIHIIAGAIIVGMLHIMAGVGMGHLMDTTFGAITIGMAITMAAAIKIIMVIYMVIMDIVTVIGTPIIDTGDEK